MSEDITDLLWRKSFHSYVEKNVRLFADDLVALLNRAAVLNIAVCPDVDENEGVSYDLEWVINGVPHFLSVEWTRDGSGNTVWKAVSRDE